MSEIVKVTIPAKNEHLLLVRLVVSGICSKLDMTMEQIDYTKDAVAKVCLVVIRDPRRFSNVEIAFECSSYLQIEIRGYENDADSLHIEYLEIYPEQVHLQNRRSGY